MNIITLNKVCTLYVYLNDPYINNLLNDFNNKRTDYIKILLERGPQQYYNEMQCGAPDDTCIYSRKPIYIYNANSMIEIAEYIISVDSTPHHNPSGQQTTGPGPAK